MKNINEYHTDLRFSLPGAWYQTPLQPFPLLHISPLGADLSTTRPKFTVDPSLPIMVKKYFESFVMKYELNDILNYSPPIYSHLMLL